ncbi:MAG TPA: flagellar FliJ family protein [Azospirillaceae bacterium]|nr:flagellar FliJ family protein [Azospirillaceae bacterium]
MSNLRPLIRLAKFELDEKRRQLAELHAESDRLHRAVVDLDAEVEREREAADQSQIAAAAFGPYLKRARAQRQALLNSLAQLEARIAAMADELAEAFLELKRYELVQEARVQAAKAEWARKETVFLDEAGAVGHRRKQQGAG